MVFLEGRRSRFRILEKTVIYAKMGLYEKGYSPKEF
jgi:hypothetical protein